MGSKGSLKESITEVFVEQPLALPGLLKKYLFKDKEGDFYQSKDNWKQQNCVELKKIDFYLLGQQPL